MFYSSQRYVNFYTDFAFKRLFGSENHKDLLIGFLNALLHEENEENSEGVREDAITDIRYLNTERIGRTHDDRRAYFDVMCITDKGERFVVEMQRAEQEFFKDRTLFYATFPIQDQAVKGEWNFELKKVYTVGILDFCFDKEQDDYYHHSVMLMDRRTKRVFYDKLEFIYLEMPKFNKKESELTSLMDKWLYAIKNLYQLDDRPGALREQVFQRFFEAAEIAHLSRDEFYGYIDSQKAKWDNKNVMDTAIKKSLQQGIEQGRMDASKGIAQKMLLMGLPVEQVAQATGLTLNEIKQLTNK